MTPGMMEYIDELRGAWRFRWIALAVALLLALLGWAVVFALPDKYEAEARIFVDTGTALKPALQGLTIDQSVDAQINYVRQSLLDGPQLEQIARATGVLAPGVTSPRERDRILSRLSGDITLTASSDERGPAGGSAGTMYDFRYIDTNRDRALKLVDNLLNTFVEKTLGGKREGSENAQKFLEAQIKDYEQRLSSAEEKLASFKKRNVGLMPAEQGGYFAQLEKEVDAEKKSETDLSIALSRREELDKQLHSDTVVSAAGASGSSAGRMGPVGGDTLTRIQETQAKLDDLLLKFTDEHPDVIATRATLEDLKRRRAKELESLRKGDAAAVAASGAGNNPVYQSMQLELNKVDVEIAALRRELAQHQGTVAELRQRLNTAPEVEAEYQQLNRDYDVNKAQYTALLESYQKTRLGERADSAGSVRFEVSLPPTSPVTPVSPKRVRLVSVIWLAALAAGAGVAYWIHTMRPIVSSVRGLSQISDLPVLGTISTAYPTRLRAQRWRDFLRFSAAAACFLIAFLLAVGLGYVGVHHFSIHTVPLSST